MQKLVKEGVLEANNQDNGSSLYAKPNCSPQ